MANALNTVNSKHGSGEVVLWERGASVELDDLGSVPGVGRRVSCSSAPEQDWIITADLNALQVQSKMKRTLNWRCVSNSDAPLPGCPAAC